MDLSYLEFEQPIVVLDEKIAELQNVSDSADISIEETLKSLRDERANMIKRIFANLTPWQISQMSRHPQRPYTLDYVSQIFTGFHELHGDRAYSDDPAIVGGLAHLDSRPVMVIGHQKGRDTKEKLRRNFGMPRPEGYRKALRLMHMAEKFKVPVFTFIDTPGAYPGIGAEERGQSEAIARNLQAMARLNVPVICTVIGEGGSGGALAIGVGDRLNMLSFSTYSVISPEGCASILWKSTEKAEDAAAAMGITATRLEALGLVDAIVEEPVGGAHRGLDEIAAALKHTLSTQLHELEQLSIASLLEQRYGRLMSYGHYKE